jgi:hypothetical protein
MLELDVLNIIFTRTQLSQIYAISDDFSLVLYLVVTEVYYENFNRILYDVCSCIKIPFYIMLNFSILLHWFKFAIAVFYAV